MKQIHTLGFLMCTFFAFSQGITFEKNLDETFAKAKKEGKLVFIEYFNSDCSVCKKIEPLLKDDNLGAYYNNYFVSYQINIQNPISEAEKLLLHENKLFFESVPFFIFFDADKKYIHHSGVQKDLNYLMEIGRTAILPARRKGSLEQKYAHGDRSVKTLYAYADLLVIQKDWKKQKEVAQVLFENFPEKDLGTQKSYTVLKNVVFSTENGFFLYWIENMKQLEELDKNNEVENGKKVLEKIILKELSNPLIKQWGETKKIQMKKWIIQLGITNNPEIYFE